MRSIVGNGGIAFGYGVKMMNMKQTRLRSATHTTASVIGKASPPVVPPSPGLPKPGLPFLCRAFERDDDVPLPKAYQKYAHTPS